MNTTENIPSIESLKSQAKRLRATLNESGHPITHSQSLEMVAGQMGYRDWNTLHAAAGNGPVDTPLEIGKRVRGVYLGQSFEGKVIAIAQRQAADRHRVTIHFDEPVDVVTFDSFSSFRQRVSCTLTNDWVSPEKTSDGQPQMRLYL